MSLLDDFSPVKANLDAWPLLVEHAAYSLLISPDLEQNDPAYQYRFFVDQILRNLPRITNVFHILAPFTIDSTQDIPVFFNLFDEIDRLFHFENEVCIKISLKKFIEKGSTFENQPLREQVSQLMSQLCNGLLYESRLFIPLYTYKFLRQAVAKDDTLTFHSSQQDRKLKLTKKLTPRLLRFSAEQIKKMLYLIPQIDFSKGEMAKLLDQCRQEVTGQTLRKMLEKMASIRNAKLDVSDLTELFKVIIEYYRDDEHDLTHGLNIFSGGSNVGKSLGVEVLLFSSLLVYGVFCFPWVNVADETEYDVAMLAVDKSDRSVYPFFVDITSSSDVQSEIRGQKSNVDKIEKDRRLEDFFVLVVHLLEESPQTYDERIVAVSVSDFLEWAKKWTQFPKSTF